MKLHILYMFITVAVACFQCSGLKFKRIFSSLLKDSQGSIRPRIINGEEVVPHSIPYQAYVIFIDEDGRRWRCGGSLISASYVLTAGHCTISAISAQVILGAHNISDATETTRRVINASTFITHGKFDGQTLGYDIGIIKLDSVAPLNNAINVVQLPSYSEASETYTGEEARASGWGLTDGAKDTLSDVLRKEVSKVITNEECAEVFQTLQFYHVCTSGLEGKGACNGDSGGPLIADNKQIGIVSFGVEYCVAGYPSAFTRTGNFLDWLAENTDVKIL